MVGTLIRAVVLIVVIVAAGTFLLGWWGAERSLPADEAVGTAGTATERAREVGAEVGERAAVAAETARQSIAESGITAKIKAKMALDDTVKALAIDVDTSGSTVTVTGTVDTAAQEQRALMLARETDGVKNVVDRVEVRR